MQTLIDAWFEWGRERPELYHARTDDGWRIAVYHLPAPASAHRTPVLLCHGMSSNRWNVDGPGRLSLARFLRQHGYDVWFLELRGAGRSTRPRLWNTRRYRWRFEDYVQHDARAALGLVLRKTGAPRVFWVGHSLGGMIAYALLMTPIQDKIAGAVTLGSPMMTKVGHPLIDFGIPYRGLLRFLPDRIPVGTLARLGAPGAPLLLRLLRRSIEELGWRPGNADAALLRTLMLTAVDDIPASLLREFAEWYEAKCMSDRYRMFDFHEHLERIRVPMLIVAGNADQLTPAEDLKEVYRRISSTDKTFRIVGRGHGQRHDYSHVDLVLGYPAPDEVYPLILDWLDARRSLARRKKEARPPRARRHPTRSGRAPTPGVAPVRSTRPMQSDVGGESQKVKRPETPRVLEQERRVPERPDALRILRRRSRRPRKPEHTRRTRRPG